MNREDVLRMAKEVYGFSYWSLAQIDDLERFAAAIRSATKEEDAGICGDLARLVKGSEFSFAAQACEEQILASKWTPNKS